MKQAILALEGLNIERLLSAAARTDALFLTRKGKVRHVLMPADDGDQEVCALRNNAEFMAYLEECVERAKKGPTYTLEQIEAHFGLAKPKRESAPAGRNGARPRRTRKAVASNRTR